MSNESTLEDLLNNDSFVRWIRGEATKKEQEKWSDWLHQNPEHRHLRKQAQTLVRLTGLEELTIPNTKAELEKFETAVDQSMSPEGGTEISYINNYRRSGSFYGAIAAGIIVLLMAISWAYFITPVRSTGEITGNAIAKTQNELQTDYGEKVQLKLSDGSTIVLNANSHLKYSSSTGKKNNTTHVWLKGEAYFSIAHLNNERVFAVHTTDGIVEVLGTQFTVKTTPQETRAVLQKGKIRLQVKNRRATDSTEKTEVVMEAGELARFSSGDREIEITKVNPAVYTSWIQDRWVFDQTPLSKVTERMEDTFGVEVKIRQKNLAQRILSGSIKSTNLKILKEALSKLLHVPVTQSNNTIVIG